MKLIDADALINDSSLPNEISDANFMCSLPITKGLFKELVKSLIDNAPTIETEPVRHGRLVKRSTLMGEYYICSACDSRIVVTECMGKPIYNFCPYCGAKMDGGDTNA